MLKGHVPIEQWHCLGCAEIEYPAIVASLCQSEELLAQITKSSCLEQILV